MLACITGGDVVTLVIAGHSLLNMGFSRLDNKFCEGIFFVSDSSITQQGTPLVSGFKKVIEMPIRVAGLNFLEEWFQGYNGYRYEGACAIAFAGSTLVAQHILNSIRNHLADLHPTFRDGTYQLAMVCEEHKFLYGDYPTDMFLERDISPSSLLSAQVIADVVEHSVQAILNQAKKHKNMKHMFSAYQADFILGICCPKTKKYHLYQYEILPSDPDGAVVSMKEILEGQVAVIGMRKLHEQDANDAFAKAVADGKTTAPVMFDFLANAIKAQNEIGVFDIGFPAFHYTLEQSRLSKPKRRES
jgi:hypothetical protein